MALLEHVDALVIGEWNGRLWLRSLATPNRPMTLIGRQNDGGVGGLAVSSDQAIVLTKGPFTVYAWNVAAKAELWHRAEPKLDCIISHPREDSAVCGTSDGRLIHLDIRSGQTIRELSLYPSGFMGLCFDGQGELLASISGDGIIAVTRWRDLKPAWPEHTYQCERAASGTLAFSACSRYLVTTAKNDVYKLLLRNVSDATIAGVLSGHEGPILGACFTPGGVLYSWGCDGSIRAWNPQSRTVIGVTEVDVSSFKRSASAIKTLDARAPCFHCRANSRVIESLTAR
jgi:WD40 repeat protein